MKTTCKYGHRWEWVYIRQTWICQDCGISAQEEISQGPHPKGQL